MFKKNRNIIRRRNNIHNLKICKKIHFSFKDENFKILILNYTYHGGLRKQIYFCSLYVLLSRPFRGPVPVSYTHLDVYKRQQLKTKSAINNTS